MAINYVTGDASRPLGSGPRIIAHVCNDIGGWGRGFVLALSSRWEAPEQAYRAWFRGKDVIPFQLGQVQLVSIERELWVANMLGQHGIHSKNGRPPISYDALRECLRRLARYAVDLNASVHMPRIGTGLAGGSWEKIRQLVDEELTAKGVQVTIYDLPASS